MDTMQQKIKKNAFTLFSTTPPALFPILISNVNTL